MHTDDCAPQPQPQPLPATTRPLANGAPDASAPPGTLYALATTGGYVVPPSPAKLHFGRGKGTVHVAIGTHDPYVSRLHGVLSFDGHEWWLRNNGRLPLCLPDDRMLLSGHELPMEPGYTPLFINTPANRSYLLEIHIVAPTAPEPGAEIYRLTEDERLVLVVLAQRYLRQERHAQPVSWKQVAEDLNRVSEVGEWTPDIAAHLVASVRDRLTAAKTPIRRDDAAGDPSGNALNHNLIRALLKNTTLMPTE